MVANRNPNLRPKSGGLTFAPINATTPIDSVVQPYTSDDGTIDEITERSAKFYNGSYKWTSEGFENDEGFYQRFSDEPYARPPTPNPPRFDDLTDDDINRAEQGGGVVERSDTVYISHSPLFPSYIKLRRQEQPQLPHPGFSPLLVSAYTTGADPNPTPQPLTSIDWSGFETMTAYKKTIPRELFSNKAPNIRERLRGRLEGLLIGQWYAGAGMTMQEAYSLVGVQYPDPIVEAGKMPPPSSPVSNCKAPTKRSSKLSKPPSESVDVGMKGAGEPAKSPFSDTSSLSDPPSDLEENVEARVLPLRTLPTPITQMFSKSAEHVREGLRAKRGSGSGGGEGLGVGQHEANNTSVDANPEDLLTTPIDPCVLGRSRHRLNQGGLGEGSGSESDLDKDGNKNRNPPKYDHEEAKKRKKKDDPVDDEEKDSKGGNKENQRKGSTRKARKVAVEAEGKGKGKSASNTNKADDVAATQEKSATSPKTSADKGRRGQAQWKERAALARATPTSARRRSARQFEMESKKMA